MAQKWNFEKEHMSQLKRVKKQKGPENAPKNAPKKGPEDQNAIELTPRPAGCLRRNITGIDADTM